jgi:S-layer homology domain
MSNSPFDPSDPQASRRSPLGFDEFVGIFVAFTVIGGIFFFTLGKKQPDLDFSSPSISTNNGTANQGSTQLIPPLLSPDTGNLNNNVELPAAENPLVPESPAPVRQPIVAVPIIPVQIPIQPPLTTTPTITLPANLASKPLPTVPAAKFADVPTDYWARPFIDALSSRQIITGSNDNNFRPNDPVTRAEFASILQRAFSTEPGANKSAFKDVPTDFWANSAIDGAVKTKFLKGYPGDVFQPEQQIPRVQMLVALASGFALKQPADEAGILRIYKDSGEIPKWATEQVAAASQAGIVVNHPDIKTLEPTRPATRAEVAAIVYQALVQSGKVEPIRSEYIVPPR